MGLRVQPWERMSVQEAVSMFGIPRRPLDMTTWPSHNVQKRDHLWLVYKENKDFDRISRTMFRKPKGHYAAEANVCSRLHPAFDHSAA